MSPSTSYDVTESSRVEEWTFLEGWCLVVQVKINRLKELLTARFADKHLMTQTAPLGATTHEKVNEQQLFLDILRSFLNIN